MRVEPAVSMLQCIANPAMICPMVYAFGIAGFIIGFMAGMFVIHLFLKGYSKHRLLSDKSLRWTYGLSVWISGGLGAWLGVWLYQRSIF